MRLKIQSRDQLGAKLGYFDEEGNTSIRGIADLLRKSLSRWGLSPKRAVLEYARNELRACGVEDVSSVPGVLQRLVDLGECDAVFVDQEPYLAPTVPHWISVGDGIAVYLGVSEPPKGLSLLNTGHTDIVRRLRVCKDECAVILDLSGVKEMSLEEWLLPLGYFRHFNRRTRSAVRSDTMSLGLFWEFLTQAIVEESMPLGPDSVVRFLEGCPGTYFGKHNSQKIEGRWTLDPGEGLWCAFRQGYGDEHWHPCIVSISSNGRRVLDLFDIDEWQWAMLARGRSTGTEEVIHQSDHLSVKLTFQAPSQLIAAMDILGSRNGTWTWEISPGGPDLWSLLH